MMRALHSRRPANLAACNSVKLLAGDYGLGFCANSLELGCDCVGTIHYFDGLLSNATGEPFTDARSFAHPQACLTCSAARGNPLIPSTLDLSALLFDCGHLYHMTAYSDACPCRRAICAQAGCVHA